MVAAAAGCFGAAQGRKGEQYVDIEDVSDAAMRQNSPAPKGCGKKAARRRCEPLAWNNQARRLAPCRATF